jgi:hypothetical protein
MKMGIIKEKTDEFWRNVKLDMVKRASPRLSRSIKNGGLLDLVDDLLFVIEDMPEKLLKKIGKVLGERWICWGDMDEW